MSGMGRFDGEEIPVQIDAFRLITSETREHQ
jgi:hypothetical protein